MTEGQSTTVERASGLAAEHEQRLAAVYRRELRNLVDGTAGWTSELNSSIRGLGLTSEVVEGDVLALEEYDLRAASAEGFDAEANAEQRRDLQQKMREIDDEVGRLQRKYEQLEAQDRGLQAAAHHVRTAAEAVKRFHAAHPRLFEGSSR